MTTIRAGWYPAQTIRNASSINLVTPNAFAKTSARREITTQALYAEEMALNMLIYASSSFQVAMEIKRKSNGLGNVNLKASIVF